MAKEQVWNQFEAGWCPSDDVINGRKNALLQMDNVELDKNGSLSLIGGVQAEESYNTGAPIEMAATVISGSEVIYSANSDGSIYRGASTIASGGDSAIAAFGKAFDYVLAASGNTRVKDNGVTTYQLGLDDLTPLSLSLVAGNYTPLLNVNGSTITWTYFGGTSSGTQATPVFVMTGFTGSYSRIILQADGELPSYDWTSLPNGGAGSVSQSDSDILTFSLTATTGNFNEFTKITLTLYSDAGGTGFQATQDITNSGTQISISFKRSDFTLFSSLYGTPNWATINDWQIILEPWDAVHVINTIDFTLSLTIIPIVDAAITTYSTHFAFYRGINTLDTPQLISYAALAVATSSSYVGTSSPLGATNSYANIWVPPGVAVQVAATASTDPQVNGIWIYREGGNLAQWYRVLVAPNTTGNYIDAMDDLTAEGIDLVLNLNLISVKESTLDKIHAIMGPMEGRWFYFSSNFMYPSDINDPDLIDVSLGVRTCGGVNEILMWAISVAEGYILVGTTIDVYVLSGTFATLPDNSIDIYYRPLVCQHPPIAIDATFEGGLVYYIAADGWRSIGTDASTSKLLVSPNTDQLYKGVERYGYTPALANQTIPGLTRFPVVVTNNKLWCCVGNRVEVWDFTRQYWRTFNYGIGPFTAITRRIFGEPLVGYAIGSGGASARIDSFYGPFIVNTGVKQTVNILSPMFNPGGSFNRNDLYTLKIRLLTGIGEVLYINLIGGDGTSYRVGGASSFNSSGIEQEIILDLNSVVPTPQVTWQYSLTGQFSQLVIADIRVEYDQRPDQLTSMKIYNSNFGSAARKRVRMWPHVIDTLGNDVTFTPIVDGVAGVAQIINTTDKTTVPVFLNWDAFGTDYGALLTGGPFEYWEGGQPEVVQTLPTPKQYDQIGPKELFRYGKVREFELRLVPYGGAVGTTSILPYTFYFDDYNVLRSSLTVNNGLEQTYSFGVPKGTSGSIVRIELGPVTYNFVRYSFRVRVMLHGKDSTDNSQWIAL